MRWAPSCRVIHGEFFELRAGDRHARVWRHWVPLDDAVTLRFALDKTAVHEVLSRAGLPLPEHEEWDASKLNGAVEFLERSSAPCVVKPTGGASGLGGDDRRPHARPAPARPPAGGPAVAPPADRAPGRGRHVPAAVHGRRAARHGAPPPAARDRRRPLHDPRADRGRERRPARSGPSGLDADPAGRPRLPFHARGGRPVARVGASRGRRPSPSRRSPARTGSRTTRRSGSRLRPIWWPRRAKPQRKWGCDLPAWT